MAKPRIIGYGICGPEEAGRYMKETLEEFKRLCDDVIICINAPTGIETESETLLIDEYGFRRVQNSAEWGRFQWKIKQEFVQDYVSKLVQPGDVMVCLDMDERFDKHITRDWLLQMPFDAYKVFVVDLWNDAQHYKPESCFWNTRIWRWTGNTEWTPKPLHCGLAPRWAAAYNRYAPFLLIHKGLMLKEDRARKIARYEKYDPHAKHLARPFYAMLHSDSAKDFDEESLHAIIEDEVKTYKQTRPRALPPMSQPKGRFAYVTNPGGMTIDIPEKQLAETLKRKGFTFVGWADDAEEALEEMFADEVPRGEGNYQRSMDDEQQEVTDLTDCVDKETSRAAAEALPELRPTEKKRLGMKDAKPIKQAPKVSKTPKPAKK